MWPITEVSLISNTSVTAFKGHTIYAVDSLTL